MVGFGHLEQGAKDLAENLGIKDRLIFTGPRGDVYRFLSITDIFCAVSSLENCFSATIIEAMHYNIPCIITNAGLSKKYFENYAKIVRSQDPDSISNGILELLKSPKKRSLLSKSCEKFLQDHGFSREKIVKKNLDIYRRLRVL